MYAPPPAIRALWPTPALGDWAVRDVNRPISIAGGDGLALENDNLPQREVVDDEASETGVGQPIDVSTSQGRNQTARRSVVDRGAYAEQYYTKPVSHMMTHSLGRETLYNWADAQFNIGGPGYPHDFGFGPGYHGDCTVEMGNVQLYMRPGIWRRPAAK